MGLCYEEVPRFTGAAVLAAGLPSFQVITMALLYAFGAHGSMTLNDFKALDGDRRHGVRSLPVTPGPDVAARVACTVMGLAQVPVISLLLFWGRPYHAIVVGLLLLWQIRAMATLLREPIGAGPGGRRPGSRCMSAA